MSALRIRISRVLAASCAGAVVAGALVASCVSGAGSAATPRVAPVVFHAPTTRNVSCDQKGPAPLRLVGGGPDSAVCYAGTGIESIGAYVQGISTTQHTGAVFIQSADQCHEIPFKQGDFVRIDAVVCVLQIDTEG